MAYMSTEHAATIRKKLKAAYPHIKFSVTKHHSSTINVSLMESPFTFKNLIGDAEPTCQDREYTQINHYYLEKYGEPELLKGIYKIVDEGNFDKSDIQTDYFHCGFYVNLNVGQWDKPYKKAA